MSWQKACGLSPWAVMVRLAVIIDEGRLRLGASRRMGWMRRGVVMGLVMLLAGCVGGSADSGGSGDKPGATYSGLAGQSCAVIVWADNRTRSEFNRVQLDLARAVQEKLTSQAKKDKKGDAPSTQFIDPRSVVRFQREHPEYDGMPIAQVAPKLGVPRVIHIEVEDLQTQSPRSLLLLNGFAKVNLRVVEVTEGQARVVFEESGITASYPPNAPGGVVPNDRVNAQTIYEGTLAAVAERIAARLKAG